MNCLCLPSFVVLLAVLLSACSSSMDAPERGSFRVPIWREASVAFDPSVPADSVPREDGTYRLDAGRILLKSVVVPSRERRCDVWLDVTVTSAGDPWDKSGAVFAFSDEAGRDFLKRMQEGGDADTTRFAGIEKEGLRMPALELMRFITPFGVGHFSHTERAEDYRPEAVAAWADSAHWRADLSGLQPWLGAVDTLWVGAYIDTWTAEGYALSAELVVDESPLPCDWAPQHDVTPLFNTTKLAHDQRPFTQLPDSALRVHFTLARPGQADLLFLTTGHGGHSGGDEFTEQPHHLLVDGDTVDAWTPWRDDCAAMRRFNPTSGFWPSTYVYKGDTLEERVASSDLSRSNWCPGDQVVPRRVGLGALSAGTHTLEVAVPGAQRWAEGEFNFWNLAGWLEVSPAP
jgi:hypothetical protein